MPSLLLLWSGAACAGQELAFNPATPLYTRDRQSFAVKDLARALDILRGTGKPIVLYIHGRGDEPGKSLRASKSILGLGSAVPRLEDQYDTAVLMFNWDSKGASITDRSRPLHNIPVAADAMNAVMLELQAYYSKDPAAPPITLVAHSMGVIVVQNYVEKFGWNGRQRMFSNVLFTGADADNIGHASWVEQIGAVERVFIAINPGDMMLNHSIDSRASGSKALGLDPGAVMAARVFYVELGSTWAHEVFDKKSMRRRANVCHFFSTVLWGALPDFSAQSASVIAENQRYRLFPVKAAKDSCFAGPLQSE